MQPKAATCFFPVALVLLLTSAPVTPASDIAAVDDLCVIIDDVKSTGVLTGSVDASQIQKGSDGCVHIAAVDIVTTLREAQVVIFSRGNISVTKAITSDLQSAYPLRLQANSTISISAPIQVRHFHGFEPCYVTSAQKIPRLGQSTFLLEEGSRSWPMYTQGNICT